MKTIITGIFIIICLILASIVIANAQPAPGPVKKDTVVHYVIVRAYGQTLRLSPADVIYLKSVGCQSVNRVLAAGAPLRGNEQADIAFLIIKNRK